MLKSLLWGFNHKQNASVKLQKISNEFYRREPIIIKFLRIFGRHPKSIEEPFNSKRIFILNPNSRAKGHVHRLSFGVVNCLEVFPTHFNPNKSPLILLQISLLFRYTPALTVHYSIFLYSAKANEVLLQFLLNNEVSVVERHHKALINP